MLSMRKGIYIVKKYRIKLYSNFTGLTVEYDIKAEDADDATSNLLKNYDTDIVSVISVNECEQNLKEEKDGKIS